MRSHVVGFTALVGALASGPLTAQGPPELTIERADGATRVRALDLEQGFAAVPIGLFEELGWAVAEVEGAIAMLGPHGVTLALTVGSPFFTWDDEVLQLADVPYRGGGQARVPIQLLADFLPRRLPELYTFDGSTLTLQAAEAEDWSGTTVVQLRPDAQEPDAEDPAGQDSDAQLPSASTAAGAGAGAAALRSAQALRTDTAGRGSW